MRLVQLTVPTGKQQTILETLDDREIDYVLTDEQSNRDYAGVVYFPLPAPAVEPVLDELQDAGIDEDAYTVVVDAETVVSRRFEALRDEYENGDVNSDRISRQELQAEAQSLTPTFAVYAIMTIISAVVATAGLLLDSPGSEHRQYDERVSLPTRVNEHTASATYNNGVLEVVFDPAEESSDISLE